MTKKKKKQVKIELNGWVVMTERQGTNRPPYLAGDSFSKTKQLAIAMFTSDGTRTWQQWRRLGYKCVRAVYSITTNEFA